MAATASLPLDTCSVALVPAQQTKGTLSVTHGGSTHAGGGIAVEPADNATVAPVEEDDDEEMDEKEALALGLPADQTKRRLDYKTGDKAKKRRTKQEMLGDELLKIQQDVTNVISSLQEWPKRPNGYEIGRCERSINCKLKQFKDNQEYDGVRKLEDFLQDIQHARLCMQAASKYIPAKGLPRKQHAENFLNAFSAASEVSNSVVRNFPQAVLQHYSDLSHTKDVENGNWNKVANNLKLEVLTKIWEDESVAEGESLRMAEKVIDKILQSPLEQAESDLNEACQKIILGGPAVAVSSRLQALLQLVNMDPAGAPTLDSLINSIQDQAEEPIIRIFLSAETGKGLLSRATDMNNTMQARATKVSTLDFMKDSCQLFFSSPVVQSGLSLHILRAQPFQIQFRHCI